MNSAGDGGIRVLHVDDDRALGEVVALHLERLRDDMAVVTETSVEAALERLATEDVDCVVSDHDMPGKDGLEFLRHVRASDPDLPFVLFTGTGSEEIASEAISAGVTEYLQKGTGTDQYAVLANRIEHAVSGNRAATALAESERMLSTLVENLPGMVYRCRNEPGWPMEFVSDGAESVTGYGPRAIETGEVTWGELIHDDDREAVRGEVQAAVGTGEAFEVSYRIETRDGETRLVSERGQPVDADEDPGTIEGFVTDVTEQRDRQRELRRYKTIIQAVGDPVYTLDEDGVFTFVNEAMESLSGYDRAALIGEHVSAVMVEEDVATGKALIADLLERDDDAYETFEMAVVTADGEHVPCENNVAILPSAEGEFRGTAGVVRDISERKERERRLEEFASVVSHDLRSPLNVVQGRVDLAVETGDVSHLDPARDAADRMERLVADLLRLAREGERVGETAPVSLERIARDAWAGVTAPSTALDVTSDRTLEADPDRLRELFENLYRNAIEHGRGDAQADAGPAETDVDLTIRVGVTDEGFFVEDDGVGIPQDRREAVFERGHTTSRDGTGFGLAIVESIGVAHGWTIDLAESDAGGARFEFRT